MAQDSRKIYLFTRLLIYYKEYWRIQIRSQMERRIGRGPEQRSFCPAGAWGPSLQHMEAFWLPNLEALPTSSWVLMEASLQEHIWLNHWLLVTEFNLHLLPIPGGQGWDWMFPPYNHLAGSTGHHSSSFGAFQKPPHSQNKRHLYHSQALGNPKDFLSCEPRIVVKTNINEKCMFLIRQCITHTVFVFLWLAYVT